MPAVLWILAVGSFWTFAFRVYHTWRELNRIGAIEAAGAHGASAPSERASNTDAERRDAPDITTRVPAPR
jgi:hypothetical protein